MDGKVKWFDPQKHYGFISSREVGRDVFLHQSAMVDGNTPVEGDRVTFITEETDRGIVARNVQIISR
jgi:CspA family cold shock protein